MHPVINRSIRVACTFLFGTFVVSLFKAKYIYIYIYLILNAKKYLGISCNGEHILYNYSLALKWFERKLQKWVNSLNIDQLNYNYSSEFAHFCNFYLISRYTIDPLFFISVLLTDMQRVVVHRTLFLSFAKYRT